MTHRAIHPKLDKCSKTDDKFSKELYQFDKTITMHFYPFKVIPSKVIKPLNLIYPYSFSSYLIEKQHITIFNSITQCIVIVVLKN